MSDLRITGELLLPVIAYGDAAGLPVETKSAAEIAAQYGRIVCLGLTEDNPFFSGEHGPGQWSDDTQLSVGVAKSLMRSDGFVLSDQAEEHAEIYFETPQIEYKGKKGPRGWGGSTARSVERIMAGISPYESGALDGQGNGIIMKMAPLVLWQVVRGTNHNDRFKQYDQLTAMTHNTAVAKVCSRVHGDVLFQLLQNQPQPKDLVTIIKASAKVHEQVLGESSQQLTRAFHFLEPRSDFSQVYVLENTDGKGFFVPQTLAMTYATFLSSSNNFEAAVYNAVNLGGDTDSTASVVGTMNLFQNKAETKLPEDHVLIRDLDMLQRVSRTFIQAALKEGV